MTSKVLYKGGLRTVGTHIRSGLEIITDAPVDNHGKGEAFSPTDLLATSLGSCMLTVMGILADRHGVDMEGTYVEILKQMADNPRRVSGIKAVVVFPGDKIRDEKHRKILEHAALNCPVAKSLHPDLQQEILFRYEPA